MSMSEKETIKYIRMILRDSKMSDTEKAIGYVYATEAIETLIEALEKKDKIIDLMAEEIDDCGECPHEIYEEDFDCEHCENYSSINCWRQYFEKKVEEE